MATCYDALELSCALKPWALLHELEATGDAVVYLDSDVEVFHSLEDIIDLARTHSLVLTPHLTTPPARGADLREENVRLIGGAFNNGFLAVSPSARPFLEWWRDRLARECLNRPEDGYFVDQRWVDLVPGYFEHHVLTDPGCNVGPWNVDTRHVALRSGYEVDGVPLRFFHYGGFEPEAPYVLSRWHRPQLPILLSEHPALARLCREYAAKLQAQGYASCSRLSYAFASLESGLELDRGMRDAYRSELIASEHLGAPEPPSPFIHGERTFLDWWNASPEQRQRMDFENAGLERRGASKSLVRLHRHRGMVGMTWPSERAYCHWYANRAYTGYGDVVELGCWLGALTAPLVMGLLDHLEPSVRARKVHAFDRFRWDSDMTTLTAAASLEGRYRAGDSFRAEFDARMAPWRDHLVVHEGDLCEAEPFGDPIEFLLVDAMKSWALANAIVRAFFPSLIPGRSLVMHQDFAHYQTYWIHLVMFRLRGWFDLHYDVPGSSSVVFRLRRSLQETETATEYGLESFVVEEIEEAFAHSLSIVRPAKQPNVAAAKIVALFHAGELGKARDELARWSRYPFSLNSDLAVVERLLATPQAT